MTVTATPPVTADEAREPLHRIWARLARPFSPPETVDAILGLSPTVVRQLLGTVIATSGPAEHLLHEMPRTVRSLATSMQTHAERCVGDVRGPILWSETMSARASSNGAEDLFVCATPSRAFDITENQVLVAALDAVLEASEMSRLVSEAAYDDDQLRHARAQGDRARLFLQHPSLRGVTRKKPDARALSRTRSGRSRESYAPALAMLEHVADPIDVDDLLQYVDRRTKAQQAALLALVDKIEERGNKLPPFRAEEGVLYAGPIQYHHPRTLGNVDRLSGIVIGNLLIDVPDRLRERNRKRAQADLEARSHGRRCLVVMDRTDIEKALRLAVTLAKR